MLALAGCATEEPGITPDRDRFYFPTALALDPTRAVLYVISSNADLQHNGGTLTPLDLGALPTDLQQVGARVKAKTLDCHPLPTDRTIWECPETQFAQPEATLRIGNYASEVAVTADGKRLFVPVRGQNHVLWADIVDRGGGKLDLRCSDQGCAGAGKNNCETWDCDATHQVNFSTPRQKALPAEPFGLTLNELVAVHVAKNGRHSTCRDGVSAVPCACGATPICASVTAVECCRPAPAEAHLYVTHLAGGEISFFSSSVAGLALLDIRGGFFTAAGDIRGGFALASRTPGDPEAEVYASSRVDSQLASFRIVGDNQGAQWQNVQYARIADGHRTPVGAITPGNDVRGIAFAPGGDRLYLLDRLPASLVALDMTPNDAGSPKGDPLWAAEVCGEPSTLRLARDWSRPTDPAATLAYVVCFGASQIFVVDTTSGRVVDELLTGRGPNGLVIDAARKRAFVANFLDNTVGVVDLDPTHATYNRLVMHIGTLRNLIYH